MATQKRIKRPKFAVVYTSPGTGWFIKVFDTKKEAVEVAVLEADEMRREAFVMELVEVYVPRTGADVVKV